MLQGAPCVPLSPALLSSPRTMLALRLAFMTCLREYLYGPAAFSCLHVARLKDGNHSSVVRSGISRGLRSVFHPHPSKQSIKGGLVPSPQDSLPLQPYFTWSQTPQCRGDHHQAYSLKPFSRPMQSLVTNPMGPKWP